MESKLFKSSKGIIEYTSVGKGQTLLFAHGGHFNCQVTLFHKGFDKNRFNILTPSRPGYGRTTLLGNRSPKETAKLFIELLDELKIQKVIVIGISAGGLTAIEIAANFPNRISKMILISSITKKWNPKHASIYLKSGFIFKPPIEKYSWKLLNLLAGFFPIHTAKTIFKEVSTLRPPQISKDEIEELKKMIKKQRSYQGFENDLNQSIENSIFEKVQCPTLILHSNFDNVVAMEHAKYAKKEIKNASLKSYNNRWGHILWLGKECEQPIKDSLFFIQN